MSEDRAFHYVCTHAEARDLVEKESDFWISNCGCREGKGHCERSRMDVCLQFRADAAAPSTSRHEVAPEEVRALIFEAETKHLVARPYRDAATRTETHGICFCCDDCCGYFQSPEEKCDKGSMIESTDVEMCNDCMACVDACYFGAREAEGETLRVIRDLCYGCGLCVATCPLDCIELNPRTA